MKTEVFKNNDELKSSATVDSPKKSNDLFPLESIERIKRKKK